MNARKPIAAEIPPDLVEMDELLTRYGRSVMDRFRKQHCASAEGRYNTPPNDDDRQPREVLLPPVDAQLVQRALAGVNERERIVLQILYIPKRFSAQAQFRHLRIPPDLAATRHLAGLREFASRWHIESVKAERAHGGLRRILRRTRVEAALRGELEQLDQPTEPTT